MARLVIGKTFLIGAAPLLHGRATLVAVWCAWDYCNCVAFRNERFFWER